MTETLRIPLPGTSRPDNATALYKEASHGLVARYRRIRKRDRGAMLVGEMIGRSVLAVIAVPEITKRIIRNLVQAPPAVGRGFRDGIIHGLVEME